jgi:hypothetical protein
LLSYSTEKIDATLWGDADRRDFGLPIGILDEIKIS